MRQDLTPPPGTTPAPTYPDAKAENEDMYAAIDSLVDKLDRQILKHKEKNVDRMHGATAR